MAPTSTWLTLTDFGAELTDVDVTAADVTAVDVTAVGVIAVGVTDVDVTDVGVTDVYATGAAAAAAFDTTDGTLVAIIVDPTPALAFETVSVPRSSMANERARTCVNTVGLCQMRTIVNNYWWIQHRQIIIIILILILSISRL